MLSNLAIVYGHKAAVCDKQMNCMVSDALYVKDNSNVNISDIRNANIEVRARLQAKDNASVDLGWGKFKAGVKFDDSITFSGNIDHSQIHATNVQNALNVKDNGNASIGYKGI
jgi:hypothetical protein